MCEIQRIKMHGETVKFWKKCSLRVFNMSVRDRTLSRRLMWMLLLKHGEEYLTGSGLESDCTYRAE